APASRPLSARGAVLAGALLLAALLLRFGASLGDLLLDEIWSIRIAHGLDGPPQVLTAVHQGNNRHLNTLLLWLLGELDPEWLYRLPSVLAGTAAVALAGAIAWRCGRRAAWLAMTLVTFSYLLVHYSSEARGYAFAMFFALLSFLLLRRYHEDGRTVDAAAFTASAALGFLAHLTFLHVYAGAAAWSLWHAARGSLPWRRRLIFLARPHLPVVLFLLAFWWVDLRLLFIGGDTPYSLLRVVRSTVALTLGAPESGWLATAALIAGIAAFLFGVAVLWRRRADEWVLFVVAIALSPAVQLLVDRPRVLYERFFLLSATLLLLLVALCLDRLMSAGAVARLAALGLIGAFLVGNARLSGDLLAQGRGDYRGAIRYMAEHSTAAVITVGSDYDFRNQLV